MSSVPKIRWLNLIALIPAIALGFIDQTILPVALPAIGEDFSAQPTALQWAVNSYLLSICVFTVIGGKIGDRLGHRAACLLGLLVFAFFSICCGLSPNIECLIAARAFQGMGAAIMFPAQTALVGTTFHPAQRGKAMGIVVSCGSLFLILGPMVGGYLTQVLDWRWIFWVNIPVALIGIVLLLACLPKSARGTGKIDLLGFIYFAIFVISASLLFMQAEDWGWGSKKVLLFVMLALVFCVLAIKREKKTIHPFLDLSLFKRPVYAAINLNISIIQFVLMISVFRTVYLETILDYSPIQTGLISSVAAVPILFLSPIAGILSDKVSPKLPIAIGFSCVIVSFFLLSFFSIPSFWTLFCALLLFGIGTPLIMTPSYSTGMSAVPKEKLGIASGMVLTLRMFGATMGLSLIHLYVTTVQQKNLPLGPRQAEIISFSDVHAVMGALLVVVMIATMLLHNRKSSHRLPESPAEGWD